MLWQCQGNLQVLDRERKLEACEETIWLQESLGDIACFQLAGILELHGNVLLFSLIGKQFSVLRQRECCGICWNGQKKCSRTRLCKSKVVFCHDLLECDEIICLELLYFKAVNYRNAEQNKDETKEFLHSAGTMEKIFKAIEICIDMLPLDGAYGSGGGQIVRNALALSTVTGKPFTVTDIRKGRPNPGLKSQHLFCIKALEDLSNAKAEGAVLGSETVTFFPGTIQSRTLSIDIGTAGSITLLLQALLIPCLFAPGKVRLKISGGTDTKWAMPVDYCKEVFLPHIRKYGEIDCKIMQRGYYPKGNGKLDMTIKPKLAAEGVVMKPEIVLLEQGELLCIKGVSHASKDLEKAEVAERQTRAAKQAFHSLQCPVQIQTMYAETLSPGSGIVLWALFGKEGEVDEYNPAILGADALGERGKRAELVGQEAGEKLLQEIKSKAPVDRHLADNLIPFLGLFGGKMKVSEISKHCLTNIYVTEQFLGKKFVVDTENNIIITADTSKR